MPKKNLKVQGKVQFLRHEIVKILSEILLYAEDTPLQLERVVAIDKDGNPVDLDSFVCYVHQSKNIPQDDIPDTFDPPTTHEVVPGFSRPNRGLGKALKELFHYDDIHTFQEIYQDLKVQFPHLTEKDLRTYLKRPEMTGGKLEIEGEEYWNPKGQVKN